MSLGRLSRYTSTMSIWWISRLNIKQRAKYICGEFFLTVSTKVSAKLISDTYEKPCATNLALNLATEPLMFYFTLNTYFDLIVFYLARKILYSQIWWFSRFCNSYSIVFCQ